MDTRLLQLTDLNLLLAFHVLLEEGNVSRAADRMNITQPAMSKTLSRLRQVFDDPLFTRNSHGMLATPRALELAGDLSDVLGNITQLLSDANFDPGAYQGEITMALSEYIGVALMPPLMHKLQYEAPRLTLKTITRVDNQLDKLGSGELDFAIHIEHARYGDEFQLHSLGSNPLAVLARENHPLVDRGTSWETLADYPAIKLYISDLDQAEIMRSSEAFARLRNRELGTFETSHLLTALEVLRNSDYVMTAPSYLLRNPAASEGIVALPMPKGNRQELRYMLVSHRRSERSALHSWFREQLITTIGEIGEATGIQPVA